MVTIAKFDWGSLDTSELKFKLIKDRSFHQIDKNINPIMCKLYAVIGIVHVPCMVSKLSGYRNDTGTYFILHSWFNSTRETSDCLINRRILLKSYQFILGFIKFYQFIIYQFFKHFEKVISYWRYQFAQNLSVFRYQFVCFFNFYQLVLSVNW